MMKKSLVVVGCAVAVPLVLTAFSGCRGQLRQVAEDEIAEAVVNQAISSYYSASVGISGEYASLNLTCSKGGTLTWAEFEEDGDICYMTDTNGCTMSGQNYGSLTLSGEYEVCGYPASYTDGSLQDLDGKTLYITGSVEVSGANVQTRTCDYDLEITAIQITGDGASLTFASGVSGSICNSRGFSSNVEFTVSGSIDAAEGDQS